MGLSINIHKLDEQVKHHKQDYYTKKLTIESYIKLLLFVHLQEIESLHALSDALLNEDLQNALGFESISVSSYHERITTSNRLFSLISFWTLYKGFNVSTRRVEGTICP